MKTLKSIIHTIVYAAFPLFFTALGLGEIYVLDRIDSASSSGKGKAGLEEKVREEKAASPEDNSPEDKEKLQLFDYDNVGEIDFSRKRITLDVYIDGNKRLAKYRDNKDKIFKYVSDFYKGMNVDLDINFVDSINQSVLKPARHLAVEIYSEFPEGDCTKRGGELHNLEEKQSKSPRKSALSIAYTFYRVGQAAINKNVALVCYSTAEQFIDVMTERLKGEKKLKRFLKQWNELGEGKKEVKWENEWIEKMDEEAEELVEKQLLDNFIKKNTCLILHELGHLFGLYHSNLFTNDPIPDYLSESNVPNFMLNPLKRSMPSKEFPLGIGFSEFQKKIIHSYLSGGKVYRQFEAVNFDLLTYTKHIEKANCYSKTTDLDNLTPKQDFLLKNEKN